MLDILLYLEQSNSGKLSILHWRCLENGKIALPRGFTPPFNTPLEMRDKDMSEYQLSRRLTFQYSIGDAGAGGSRRGPGGSPATFNTPLEMPVRDPQPGETVVKFLSILHWRCC
jgi:hypothetical protein